MHTLLFYLDKTKGICKCYQVFMSYVSYRSVCTKTVAQWLKEVLSNSGIDTAVFKAHSFRGLLLQPILTKAVLYSKFLRQGTGYLLKKFKNFYLHPESHRSNTHGSFVNAILS